jgi:hypothetical protein
MSTLLVFALGLGGVTQSSFASGGGSTGGGGGGSTVKVDTIKVSKCYWNSGGEMLIKAASSDPTARLFAYSSSGTLIGEVQNGGGSRYGGTVMGYTPVDPILVLIVSTSGGSVIVPTTPFQI